jgi:hypothetical protein
MVLNVAHSMIPICMEIMHVLLQLPGRSACLLSCPALCRVQQDSEIVGAQPQLLM